MTRMPSARTVSLALLLGLQACTVTSEQTVMDKQRLVGTPSAAALECPMRLLAVVDSRAEGEDAGQFGKFALQLDDVAGTIRQQLLRAGLQPNDREGVRGVTVALRKFYTTQSLGINTPVVVYEAAIDGQPPFLVRPQAASINWRGTQDEMYDEFNAALGRANAQLIDELNKRCD